MSTNSSEPPTTATEPMSFANQRFLPWCSALVLDTHGIHELQPLPVVTPWPRVRAVHWFSDHVDVHLGDRTLRVDARFGDWQRFGEEVESRLALLGGRPQRPPVSARRIAQLLGIEDDGRVACEWPSDRWQRWAGVLGCLAGIGVWWLMAWLGAVDKPDVVPLLVAVGCGCVATLWRGRSQATRACADVHGVSLRVRGRPRAFAWSEVRRVQTTNQSLEVHTERAVFRLSVYLPNVDRVAAVLQDVIEARSLGMEVPGEPLVSAAALSRMSGDEAETPAVERGLSRSEGPSQ